MDGGPDLRQRVRAAGDALEIAPAHVVALLVVASCACAGLVALWWTSRPAGTGPAPPAAVATAPAIAGVAPSAAPDRVVVHVSGAVRTPGVRELPGDARVGDAVDAAGGLVAEAFTDQLNLARPVRDGEQIHVPDAGEAAVAEPGAGSGPGGGAGGGVGAGGPVNLNHATAAQLEELPGIGPVLAERVVRHREANGGFRSVDELQQVPGIGEKILAGLEDLVGV